jgi:large subunit ribosomal protein L7/L12
LNEVAERHGVELYVSRLFEAMGEGGDPLALFRERADQHPPGEWEVVLWRTGDDRVATMRVVRELTGSGLAEVKTLVADLPKVVLSGIRVDVAHDAAKRLSAVGAEATADRPKAPVT